MDAWWAVELVAWLVELMVDTLAAWKAVPMVWLVVRKVDEMVALMVAS